MNGAAPTGHLPVEAAFLMSAERRCYVAATMETEDGGVLEIRGVDPSGSNGRSPKLLTFDDEPAATGTAGRKGRRAPAVLVEAQPNA